MDLVASRVSNVLLKSAVLNLVLILVKRVLNASESSFSASAISFNVSRTPGAPSTRALTAESIFGCIIASISAESNVAIISSGSAVFCPVAGSTLLIFKLPSPLSRNAKLPM